MQDIYIFGRGSYYKLKEKSIKEKYQIIGCLDNSVEDKIYDDSLQMMVYNPKHISKLKKINILCTSIYFIQMWQQLKKLGVESERILIAADIKPYYDGFEEVAFLKGEKIVSKNNGLKYIVSNSEEYSFESIEEMKSIIRKRYNLEYKEIKLINELGCKPISRRFGLERGNAVDRKLIEDFIEQNSEHIIGTVMEVGTDIYSQKYGTEDVRNIIVLHVKGWGKNAIKGNFETGEGIKDNMVDCLICTQTLQYIFDLKSAVQNIYRMIKPGGYLLLTVPGIKSLCTYDDDNWGEKWSFTEKSIRQLFEPVFGRDNCEINTYGNVKIATAYMYGICYEELKEEDFSYNDKQFPFIITAAIRKI